MKYVERRPGPALRPHVECVWAVWDEQEVAERRAERIVPDGCPELILHLGDAFARRDERGGWRTQPRAFLAGTLTRPWNLRPGGRPRTLGVRFRPGAARMVLGVPMDEIADRETNVEDLWGAAGAELLEAADNAPHLEGALRVAESWTERRLSHRPARQPEVRPAVDLILACRGRTRIADAARGLGWSRRRLERAFLRDVGVSPKRFARIVRLNAALASLTGGDRESAVDVALDAGYFDQAHLLRDFRALAGATPRHLGGGGALSRQLLRPERLRALLLPPSS